MAISFKVAGGILAAAVASKACASQVIQRDVAIIGGGASGAYAAIRLKEDFDQSVVVIEKAGRMGGHVSTYDDPKTGSSFNFGVQSFNDYGPAKAFFERMGVPVGSAPRVALTSQYADFTTGAAVDFTPPTNDDRVAALGRFLNATADYEQYTLPGYWNFPTPDKIPADLLLPFGEFVEKYQLHAAVNQVFQITGMGTGDMMNALTIYVLGAFGQPMIRAFLGQGATFTPSSGRNIALYEAVQSRLGNDVLLNTVVTKSQRKSTGHTIWTKSASGKETVIEARRLLIAIEPTPENLAPLDVDKVERSTLSKFHYSHIHAGIVSHPSLPVNVSLVNTPAAASPANYVALPKPNFNVRFDYMGGGSDLWRVLAVGDEKFTRDNAQALIRDNFATLMKAGTVAPKTANPAKELEFRAWADHGAMHMGVSASELKAGFIQDLYALQGRRGTWWTGGAFSVQFQAILWAFDDVLLPKMFE
ncbi:beta-cyclopiazonate dehydrogenase [Corynascus novoguineensis]|uniref:Beta-cyclopiazonate dehydrogenase n=1 Tax=Corynascus novoguineensis TaxID=1126955 RepID=A0AAN7HIF7_9PEZI|nr:beta-cyclopiazonate dehydrogenase [Corynascus novoguineensis]